MKKYLAIPLLVLYLVAVSGMMVQLHYCGSKLSSWNINQQKASCCCAESLSNQGKISKTENIIKKTDDCCKDKTITLKIIQDQYRGNNVTLQFLSLQVVLPQYFTIFPFTDLPARSEGQTYQANAPPGLWQNIPLYKLHSNFTYYG